MKYESLINYNSTDVANIKAFLKSRSKFKVKVRTSNIKLPVEMSCHKEHTNEI
jgi:hypothetical protein